MRLKAVAVVMALVLAIAVTAVSCEGGPDREAMAAEVAVEWVQERTDTVSEIVVELLILSPVLPDVVGKLPGAESLLARHVANQIGDKVSWSYSTPVQDMQALYRVTATAALEIEIDLPIIGTRTYAVTLPFHLLIDTDARAVEEWAVDLDGAAVGSY